MNIINVGITDRDESFFRTLGSSSDANCGVIHYKIKK